MFFSRILSIAAIASTALVACASPIAPAARAVSTVERRAADPILAAATTLSAQVGATAATLDGVVNPASAIAEFLEEIDAYVSAIVSVKVNATQVAVDVNQIVQEVATAYTDITGALQKYINSTDQAIIAIVKKAETDISNAVATLIEDTETFIPAFVSDLQTAVASLVKFLNITLTLQIKLTLLGLTIYL